MRLIIAFIFFTLSLLAVSLRPEELKVVYTYNFLKNIQWPKSSTFQYYNLLVLSDNDLLKENFALLTDKRDIDSKPIHVYFDATIPLNQYHAIFIDQQRLSAYKDIYKEVESASTLLISVNYPDQQAIMINLIQKKSSQLTFEIHRANILNQGLSISDKMIMLGGTEIDVAQLYKKTRQSLEDEEQRSEKLMQEIELSKNEAQRLSEHIAQQNSIIETKNGIIEAKNSDIAKQSSEITAKSDLILSLKNYITTAQNELDKVSLEIAHKNNMMLRQQQYLETLNQTAATKDDEINKQNRILEELQQRIQSHQNMLVLKEETISHQKSIIFLLLFLLSIIAVLIFFLIKLIREKKRHADRDFLTGLYNRRYFSLEAKKLYKKGIESDRPITVAMIDIDHFKSINDTYGHDIGDEALKSIASILKANLADKGLIARWGGEEFIVLTTLPNDEVRNIFESLKEQIERKLFTPASKSPFHLSVSIGLHVIKENDSLESMIKQADNLLYSAKIQGRNRIIYSD